MKHLHDEKVRFNEKYRVNNASIEKEFSFNHDYNEIKTLYEASSRIITSLISNVTTITVELIAQLNNSFIIHFIKIDFEKDIKSKEIIEMNVYEKRKKDKILKRCIYFKLIYDI